MKNVRNVGISAFAVCVLGFLIFGGEQNRVVAEEVKKPLTQEQLEAIAIQPATQHEETGSRVVPAMLPLFKEESITYTGKEKYKNETLKYRLYVPENFEADKKYPLILWLHGVGERGDDNKQQLVHLHHIITYLTGEKKRDFFLLVPQTPDDHSSWDARSYTTPLPESLAKQLNDPEKKEAILKQYRSMFASVNNATVAISNVDGETVIDVSEPFEDSPLGFSMAMLDQVIKSYPVDTDRITVSGLSSGGDGTWRALERRPDLFAAAVPLVSWSALTDKAIAASPILKKIPIWAIYSSDDNGIDRARTDFERVEKAGCNVKKSEFGICGHNAWTPAMLQADIFSWLLSRAKKDGEYIAVTDAAVNPDDLKGIVDVATRDPGKPKLAPAPPESAKETTAGAVMEVKPPASFSVPQPPQNVVIANHPPKNFTTTLVTRVTQTGQLVTEEVIEQRDGKITVTTQKVEQLPVNPAKDELYAKLAERYFYLPLNNKDDNGEQSLEWFSRTFAKLSPAAQIRLAEKLLAPHLVVPSNRLQALEKLIDQMPVGGYRLAQPVQSTVPQSIPTTEPVYINQKINYYPQETESPQFTAQQGSEEITVTGKMIEDCDRPWAMTSDSLYGMFPADWNKEAQKIPEFIVALDSDQLAKKLASSVSGDGKDFLSACQSILTLENKPMSSPWFETGGGRLRSDIRYTLSVKGQMFVRLLKTVKDSAAAGNAKNADKENRAKIARKTLEKIELIVE